jgi:hypothetical protein
VFRRRVRLLRVCPAPSRPCRRLGRGIAMEIINFTRLLAPAGRFWVDLAASAPPMAGLEKFPRQLGMTAHGRLRKCTAFANSSMLLATGGSDGAEAPHFQSRIIDGPAEHHAVLFVMMQYPPRQVPALAWHDGTITSHITSLE